MNAKTPPAGSMHENYVREEKGVGGSNRSFGIVMAVFFGVIASYYAWKDAHIWIWPACISSLFLAAALLLPSALTPMSRAWQKFGLLLHHVINPVIMAVVYFGAVVPTGLIMRLLGKDLLRLKLLPGAESYWIVRQPPGPAPDSFKDQF